MIGLNIGNTWDYALLEGIRAIHDKYETSVRVTELYGSIAQDPLGSARPDYRLPTKTTEDLVLYTHEAHKMGLQVNFTANVPCTGTLADLERRLTSIRNHLRFLEDLGVDRITVSHPLLMEIVTQETSIPIEVSTICHVNSISEIKFYATEFQVDRICMNIYRNRDIGFLRDAQGLAESLNIKLELIVNEFCNTNGSPCVYRSSCFNLHGHQGNQEKLFDNYPFGRCIKHRTNPVNWLQARFILPEDLDRYRERTGITRFKVTGRTHPTVHLLKIVECYVRQKSPKNLLDLWIHLENIGRHYDDYEKEPPLYIPTDPLITASFTDKWFMRDFRCSEECNRLKRPCTHCHDVWSKIQDSLAVAAESPPGQTEGGLIL